MYAIVNAMSGVVLGIYAGTAPGVALDALARDAGYGDYAHACEVVPAVTGEIVVRDLSHDRRGLWFIAPVDGPSDAHAAGWETNFFATYAEADAELPYLAAALGDSAEEWMVSQYR